MGNRFSEALAREQPLQIVGVVNAYAALMAEDVGFRAIYLSGAGVANASFGLPDLGLTTFDEVCEDLRRVKGAVNLPILVDGDTGWGNALMIERSMRALAQSGADAIHLEDQSQDKRCGHLPGKILVSKEEMVERIWAAREGLANTEVMLMARTDAYANEGLEGVIERTIAYKEAGAELLFLEALSSLDEYVEVKSILNLPVLANLTEFGKTPGFHREELEKAGVDMALYPLSAWRAMNHAANEVFKEIRTHGSQENVIPQMETRKTLYTFLSYEEKEKKIHDKS